MCQQQLEFYPSIRVIDSLILWVTMFTLKTIVLQNKVFSTNNLLKGTISSVLNFYLLVKLKMQLKSYFLNYLINSRSYSLSSCSNNYTFIYVISAGSSIVSILFLYVCLGFKTRFYYREVSLAKICMLILKFILVIIYILL